MGAKRKLRSSDPLRLPKRRKLIDSDPLRQPSRGTRNQTSNNDIEVGNEVYNVQPSPTIGISFLDLPPELRNRIYSFHFASIEKTYESQKVLCAVPGKHCSKQKCNKAYWKDVRQILHTNRKVRTEASGVFHTQNYYFKRELRFFDLQEFQSFWYRIGSKNPGFRASIELNGGGNRWRKREDISAIVSAAAEAAGFSDKKFKEKLRKSNMARTGWTDPYDVSGTSPSTATLSWDESPYQNNLKLKLQGELGKLAWMDKLVGS